MVKLATDGVCGAQVVVGGSQRLDQARAGLPALQPARAGEGAVQRCVIAVGIPVKWNSVSGDLEHGFRRSGTLVSDVRVSSLPSVSQQTFKILLLTWCSRAWTIPVEPVGAVCGVHRLCGKRAFGDRSVAPNASRALSTSAAVSSTGRSDPTCPGHACHRHDGSGLRFAACNGVADLVLSRAVACPSARCGARRGANGVGLVGVTDDGVPVHRQLAGDQQARSARSSITSVRSRRCVTQRREHPVVDGEQVALPSAACRNRLRGRRPPRAAGAHADVAGGEAAATRPFDEGATEKTLPIPHGPVTIKLWR